MKPRILLVEDDPISREFMCRALEALPAQLQVARSQADALSAPRGHDLWLLDANLPDGNGSDLLRRLRELAPEVPALAHTADDSPALHAALCQAGFAGVVVKPIRADALREVVRDLLGHPAQPPAGVLYPCSEDAEDWDDAAALQVLGGSRENLKVLREMFLAELPAQQAGVEAAVQREDIGATRALLHRMKASCGFVGAARLTLATGHLDHALPDTAPLLAFNDACRRLLDRG